MYALAPHQFSSVVCQTPHLLHLLDPLLLLQVPPTYLTTVYFVTLSSPSFQVSAHKDIRKRKSKTCNDFITHVNNPIPVPIDNPVFSPRGGAFELEPAHEDSATLDEDAW
ncbi:hypothetical protein EDB83DRAFT_2521255 [Lactarius deliciosus]|nr:hypothetical protein EDB83DRAFT_2521255 [Lactarius deliciosus]